MSAATPATVHRFEAAGLGTAPFRCVGVERRVGPVLISTAGGVETWSGSPGQPMGVCDYCGTGIADCYVIRSGDGREFVVGSDCVYKVGDAGLKRTVDAEKKKADGEKRKARAESTRAEVDAMLADPAVREALAARPHIRGFLDRETGRPLTALDEAEWLHANAGAAGRAKLAKWLRPIAAEVAR